MTSSPATPTPTTAASTATPWIAVATVLVGMFMAVLDGFIVIVAGPDLRTELGASEAQLQWVLAGYQLAYALALVTASRVADRMGRRRIFCIGTVVFVLASVLCAASPTAGVLIVARLVQGVGAAMVVPQVFAIVTLVVPAAERPRAFGYLGVALGLASVCGQLVGGALIGLDLFGSGWRAVFAVNVPIGAVVLLLALRYVPESRVSGAARLDLRGTAVLGVALFLLVYPLITGREAGWPWWSLAMLAASPVALVAFALLERRVERTGRTPLLRPGLFAQRSFTVGLLLVVAIYAVITSYYLALSVSMQDGIGLSAFQSGLVYLPAATAFFFLNLLAGRLVPRYGRRVLEAGAVLVTLGFLGTFVVLVVADDISPALVIPSLVLQSAGGGLILTPSMNVVLARMAPADTGMASGALSTAQQVGAALGVAVVGTVYFSAFGPAQHGSADAAAHAFALASLTTFLIGCLSYVLVRLLPNGGPR